MLRYCGSNISVDYGVVMVAGVIEFCEDFNFGLGGSWVWVGVFFLSGVAGCFSGCV